MWSVGQTQLFQNNVGVPVDSVRRSLRYDHARLMPLTGEELGVGVGLSTTAVCISVGSHFFAVSQPVRLNSITLFTSNISSLVCFRIKCNWLSLQQLANRNLQGSKEDYVLHRRMLVLLSAILFVKNLQGL